MSGVADGAPEQPIIIVRRRRGGHDEHHGGAWKIAYADFMTAMMALFLVMWLVNASSEETKAAVASYFNPIELTDRNARPRGIDDPVPGSVPSMDGEEDGPDDALGSGVEDRAGGRDGTPDGSEPDDGPDPVTTNDATALAPDLAEATEASRSDPFDPFALGMSAPALIVPASVEASGGATVPDAPSTATLAERPGKDGAPSVEAASHEEADVAEHVAAEDAAEPEPTPQAARAAAAIAAELADALAAVEVDVVAEADTVVIRLADDPALGMFALGSSVPREGLAADLSRVAASLEGRPGAVSVHGHTDARSFADAGRDGNWRLSAERAGAAHALLVAGGLDPARVARVVAHADRAPRETDALSPRNRRIEVRLALGAADG